MASQLHLSSIDYAKKRYCFEKAIDDDPKAMPPAKRYISAYMASKYYIETMLSRASPCATASERLGSFGAEVALRRLQYSFFSAHLLYQLGHKYEAHAVSRLVLEQIAWAYSASQLDNLAEIKKLVTTNCISRLRELNQGYGRLYGILSKKVHLDYENHGEFLRVKNGESAVLLTLFDYYEYAFVLLTLADLFGIVWELSQAAFIQDFEATHITDGVRSIRDDRPFKKIASGHLATLRREGVTQDTEEDSI